MKKRRSTFGMRLLRIVTGVIAGAVLVLYLTGVVITTFDLLTLRMPDAKILSRLQASGAGAYSIDQIDAAGTLTPFVHVVQPDTGVSTAVFFAHGSPDALSAWIDYLTDPGLFGAAHLYAYDRIGYGHTQPFNIEGSLLVHAEQLRNLVEYAGAEKNILVGHSYGGSVIAKFAIEFPELVHGIVIIAGPLDPDLEPPGWWRPLLNVLPLRIAVPRVFRISNIELAPLGNELRLMSQQFDKIICPVVLMYGERDLLVPKAHAEFGAKILRSAASVETEYIPGGGHLIHWSRRDRVVDYILQMAGR